MPEGPEIRRVADKLRAAICKMETRQVWFSSLDLKRWEEPLTGAVVKAVESRGKALQIEFDNQLTVFSHNQLYGRWYLCEPGDRPDTRRQLRAEILTARHSALLYSASWIEVLRAEQLKNHAYLGRLGPDLLAPDTIVDQIEERLNDRQFRRRQLGRLLPDQSFVAGIGNYLRCEILFCVGLLPSVRPAELSPERRMGLAREMVRLTHQSYRSGGITYCEQTAMELMAAGSSFEAARFWVFRREDQTCRVCSKKIRKSGRGGPPCYWCPRCQQDGENLIL